jgi:hypothetical protein
MEDKLQLALALSEEILSGMETESIKLSSAALRCLRLARLIADEQAIVWLQYENSGYSKTPDGFIENTAFLVACSHGREVEQAKNGTRQIFVELADELVTLVETNQASIGTLTTNGVSLSGDMVALAMRELRTDITARNSAMAVLIKDSKHRLAILRAEYYNYAMSVNFELKFSQRAEEIFQSYRLAVDSKLSKLAPESIRRLNAAYDRLTSDNPESWSQALTSCRRVFQEVSDALFDKTAVSEKAIPYKTASGKILDVSGDNYKNRLFAIVDKLSKSKTTSDLIGSDIMYVVDWIENIHDLLSKGVHDLKKPLTYENARRGILHTYVLLGDIVSEVIIPDEAALPEHKNSPTPVPPDAPPAAPHR